MKKILKNIHFRIITVNVVILIVSNIMIYHIMEKFILDDLRSEFEKKVAIVRPQIDLDDLENEDLTALKNFADRMKLLTHLRITILNRKGRVLADSDVASEELGGVENHLSREEIQGALMHGAGIASRKSKTINEELIYYSETIRKSGKIIGFLRTAIFMPQVNAKIYFIKGMIFKVDLVYIFMVLVSLILLSFRYRNRFNLTRTELSKQRERNEISEVSYQDDHEINKLLLEINKTLSWSKNAILESQLHQGRLTDILNSIIIGVMAFTEKGQIISVNDTFRKIFGIENQEIENQEIYKWIHFPPVISDIDHFLRDKTLPELNNMIKFYGDSYIEYRIIRQEKRRGTDQVYLITVRDVTRLRQLETVRRDFIANASHEFKTPLSTIRGFTETLLSGTVDSEDMQIKFLKKIERQTKHLENLVSDIIQLAKIEKKNISDMTRINIKSMIKEIVEEVIPLAKEHDLFIDLDSFEEVPEIQIEANPDTIRIIITNLLINAIQYNQVKGRIKIRLKGQENFCVVEVEDTGIGITKEEINRIFERFFRAKVARSIYSEGTGLGLSIVKNAVESIDGQITVKSELGKGSIFIVRLPVVPEKQ